MHDGVACRIREELTELNQTMKMILAALDVQVSLTHHTNRLNNGEVTTVEGRNLLQAYFRILKEHGAVGLSQYKDPKEED